jgi:Zn finger protein HypA/HybF involved in hydrogenase expression
MPFFDNVTKIAKSVGDTAKSAAKKSEEAVEKTKLNMAISSEEDKIKEYYNKLGQIVFEKIEKGEINDSDLSVIYSDIINSKSIIADTKLKLLELKNMKACPKCGNKVKLDVAFCPKCGTKIENPASNENDETTEDNTKEDGCTGC